MPDAIPEPAETSRPAGPLLGQPVSHWARYERPIIGLAAVGVVLGLWEVVCRSGLIKPIFLSAPSQIGAAAVRMLASGELVEHLRVSGAEFLMGYALALTAIPLGLMTGWYRRLNFALDPFLTALYVIPRVAFLPLIFLWIGVGLWSKVAIVFLGAFFPICISTIAGVRTVDPVHLRVARSFQATQLRLFLTIVLPSCVPFILAGLRLGVGRALVGVVVGELFGATAGVGYLISVAGSGFQTDKLFVGVAVLGAFGVLCNEVLVRFERRVEAWRPPAGVGQ
jgi:ABC-type nitrate/sulfonate/bicarbonate transport system permease component